MVQMTEKFEHGAINLEVAPFPVRIKADWNQLMHVLSHLIANAVKYSDAGELVTLQLIQANGWAVIQLRDKGDAFPYRSSLAFLNPFTELILPALVRLAKQAWVYLL